MRRGTVILLTSLLCGLLCGSGILGAPKKPKPPPQFEPNTVWAGFDCVTDPDSLVCIAGSFNDNFTRTAETVYELADGEEIALTFSLGTPDVTIKDKENVCASLSTLQSQTIVSPRFVFRADQDQALARCGWDGQSPLGQDVQFRFYCRDELFDDLPFEAPEGDLKTTYIVCDVIFIRVDWPKGPNSECVWEFGNGDDPPVFTIVDD